MFMLRTKKHYKVAHITNEIGKYIIGGIATVINELYSAHDSDTCFIHIADDRDANMISISNYPGDEDIFIVSNEGVGEISLIDFDIAVLHYYGLEDAVSEEIIGNRKLIYVVHSVNTPEPYEINNPFGEHIEIEQAFRRLCNRADKIICVSEAEKIKLESIIEGAVGKIEIIHNGLTLDHYIFEREIQTSRTKFGYLGRLDYRKGILETLVTLKNCHEYQYYVAAGKGDYNYLKELKIYINAADMEDRVHFLGYCTEKRRESFLKEIDCLLISSMYEPFGMILLEALQSDVPIICSNNGGLAEMLGDYKYQYDPYQPGDFEKAIQLFVKDTVENVTTECSRLKERLRLFTKEIMVAKYQKVFEEM